MHNTLLASIQLEIHVHTDLIIFEQMENTFLEFADKFANNF